ncbi:sagB-type dehydrogenase domain protein [Synechococcus sp. BIOS-E4-1]|uniref:SagB family peptide dehydrogenase n=1 Tax=Synechococcus sp. BIOS-E4-1 TaxID=1400864 RepID=UPI001647B7B4|nr:SagB family peptide dehydrogenase [Synechococcus sp. BIOS-E4-1]QNI54593.1 sagB-type dehydrogenase domain protein [Synechococcus sp. BIOS-E4-1]
MNFLIQFPEFIKIDNAIRLRSGVIDTIVPSQIIDDRIIALISQPISTDSFEQHINDLLPVLAFSCGFGRVKIFSECRGIVFELKRSCRISLKKHKTIFFYDNHEYIIRTDSTKAIYMSPSSAWRLTSKIELIPTVEILLNSDSSFINLMRSICDEIPQQSNTSSQDSIDQASRHIPIDIVDQLHIAHSRKGFDHTQPIGATFPYDVDPPHLFYKSNKSKADPISLNQLVLSSLPAVSFTTTISSRRSRKSLDINRFLSFDDLSRFLGTVFYTTRIFLRSDEYPNSYDSCLRFYPNGGGVHELEPFVVVNRVSGLDSGIYHYSPFHHQLSLLSVSHSDLKSTISEAYHSSGKESLPAVFIILVSRLERLSWKYERMAYHVTLKNTGVILGFMSQVASLLNLYGCPMGNSDSFRFSQIIGEDPLKMPAVGEFCLSPSD